MGRYWVSHRRTTATKQALHGLDVFGDHSFQPLRYICWQIVTAVCYMFQSLHACLTIVPLGFYVPIVFGILFVICLLFPVGLCIWIGVGFSEKSKISKLRILMASVLAPFVFALGTYLFFQALPLAAKSIHWLDARDVIRASNGPAYFTYKYVTQWGMPLEFPRYTSKIAKSEKEIYRSHVAIIYLSDHQHARYINHAYPEHDNQLTE